MLRTSTFLAIALSATAIASFTVPAAASQVFGGNSHIAAEIHTAQAMTSMQPSQIANRPKIGVDLPPKIATSPAKPVYSGLGPDGKLIPAKPTGPVYSGLGAGGNLIPAKPTTKPVYSGLGPDGKLIPAGSCAGIPLDLCGKLPPAGSSSNSGGGSGTGGGSTGGSGTGGGSSAGNSGKPSGNGTVVILAPPVEVPVAVPYGVPARVTSGSGNFATAQARPAIASQPITPQCGTTAGIPALAAGIDQLLPTAQLSEADMSKVTELRQMIQLLSTDGKASAARDVEEIAMNILGYQKVWLRCGLGSFDWEKQMVSADAVQQK